MGGITSLLLLLWVGLTVGTVVDLQKRIIGGQKCKDGERLYHVKLRADNGTHYLPCGGSLISKQWILTAAHCWEPRWNITAYLRKRPRKSKTLEINITEHPEIFKDKDINNKVQQHDIMLLKLPSKVTIKPVKPPNCDKEYKVVNKIGAIVQIAGHGATDPSCNGTKARDLQCANIEVVKCPPKPVVDNVDWSYQHWLCGNTTGKPLVDVCPGDSGGGVVYKKKIYGVISCSGICACTTPARFIDVCKYRQWIKDVTKPRKLFDKLKACLGCG